MAEMKRDRAELERQITALREVFLPYERVTSVQHDMGLLHRRDNGGSEGGILTLFGDARSGKTKILRDYKSRFPTVVKGLVDEEGDHADLMEVVLLRVPDTSVKNFLERLLAVLSNVGTDAVRGKGSRRFDIQEDIFAVAKTVGLKLILLEETHQGFDRRKPTLATELAGVLKDLTNESRFSMVIAGTFEAQRLVDANEELAGRVLYEHELHPLQWEVASERAMFLEVIRELDEHLKENVFGRLSGFATEAFARPLLEASLGQIGHASRLLETAALRIIDDILAADCPRLTLGHVAAVFAQSPLRRRNPDLFKDGPGGRGKPVDNPTTRLRGRTHRTNRDAAFKG